MASAVTVPIAAPVDRAGWRVLGASVVGAMLGYGSMVVYTFSPFVRPLASELGWSREQIGQAASFAGLTLGVVAPLVGKLLDRFGPRRVVLPCIAVFGLLFASLSAQGGGLWQFYATFIAMGLVGNGTTQMGYSRAVTTWFDARRGLALAIVMAGAGTGAMVMPPLALFLIEAAGWRAAYLVLGGVVLVVALPVAALFVREKPGAGGSARAELPGMTTSEALRTKPFWMIILMLVMSAVGISAVQAHLSALLTDRGIGTGQAAVVVSALGFASLVGRLFTGALLDRFFGARVGMFLLAAVAAGILLLSGASTLPLALAAVVLIGFGLGGEADIVPYLLSRYFGLRGFATLYGLGWFFFAIFGALGPWLMGRAFDATGSYQTLLAALAGLTLASAVPLAFLRRYDKPG